MLIAIMIMLYAAGIGLLMLVLRNWLIAVNSELGLKLPHFMCMILILPALCPVLGTCLHSAAFEIIGNLWLGCIVYLYMIIPSFYVVSLILGKNGRNMPGGRYRHIVSASLEILLCVVIMAAGVYHAGQTRITQYSVPVEKQAAGISDMKIAFAADLHLGSQVGYDRVEEMVAEINSMQPDLVIFGGDIFDSDFDSVQESEATASLLSTIKSRYGVYSVYGNHDVREKLMFGFSLSGGSDAFRDPRMDEFMQAAGIELLEDRAVPIACGSVWLAGRLDGEKAGDGTSDRKSPEQLLSGVDTGRPVIVIEHEPVQFDELGRLGVDLVLSGHTHAGQFFPLTVTRSFFWRNAFGEKQFGNLTSIVTSGVGLYGPPVRILTDSEVVGIDLHFGA